MKRLMIYCFLQENEENSENYPGPKSPNIHSSGPSFLEMLSGGPSRSPSPARPPIVEHEDSNNPTLTNWGFQHHTGNVIHFLHSKHL